MALFCFIFISGNALIGLADRGVSSFCSHSIEFHTVFTSRSHLFQSNCPTCFFQEQAELFGSYAPGPWLSYNLLKPQHQPGPSTGVRPTIRTGRDIGKGNPAAATDNRRTLTE
jgi:hypothetical protein